MSIDTDTARRVAKLARIQVPEADLPELANEFSALLCDYKLYSRLCKLRADARQHLKASLP